MKTSAYLNAPDFNAQHAAHRLLRSVTRADAPQTFKGYASPNREEAKGALLNEARALDLPIDARRVGLVKQWIDMNSGVAVGACQA
jgi:hypothetical protein